MTSTNPFATLAAEGMQEDDMESTYAEAEAIAGAPVPSEAIVQYANRPTVWLKGNPVSVWQANDLSDELIPFLEEHIHRQLERSVDLSTPWGLDISPPQQWPFACRPWDSTGEPPAPITSYMAKLMNNKLI